MFETEEYRNRVLLAPQGTAAGAGGYLAPTPGTQYLTVRAIVNMGNVADLPLSLKYSDDAIGTNAADFEDVPIYINGVRQTSNGHEHTVSDDSGVFIVDFSVLPGQIPQGKTLGLAYGTSNLANFIAAELIEDTTYEPVEA
ncbi:hypothetical protein AB8U03_15655 [Clostridium sp. Mt-5]|uniref:Uncharacterized protein n=1 Tax=Clostridium moutaii TaxID=3240932 RepID=A0ABV4BVS1_9CLOT